MTKLYSFNFVIALKIPFNSPKYKKHGIEIIDPSLLDETLEDWEDWFNQNDVQSERFSEEEI